MIADLLDRLDTERRYEFEERVGAIELDPKVPRDEAEALALIDLLRTHPAAHVGVTALEVDRGGVTDTVVTTTLMLSIVTSGASRWPTSWTCMRLFRPISAALHV